MMDAMFAAPDAEKPRQVLYRRWRPQTFGDMAGQEHVRNALRNAIKRDRLGQSYLLVGPKGTGKTTTARIIAKAANCQAVEDGEPCDQCRQCAAINAGTNLDVAEIDAASNRGIDEIRDLRESVRYLPSQGRRKVYIIDEVHMLTAAASNAFLKTLEEPPDHVMFVLCTTQPDSILPTITSRCQRMDFRRLPVAAVMQRLRYVADQEEIAIDEDAIEVIARNCGGSLRDAQNIMETLSVTATGTAGRDAAEAMLGLDHAERYLDLAVQMLKADGNGALSTIDAALAEGEDSGQMHAQTQRLLRHALLIAMGRTDDPDITDSVRGILTATVQEVGHTETARALDLWVAGEARAHHPDGLGMELAATKMGLGYTAPDRGRIMPRHEEGPATVRGGSAHGPSEYGGDSDHGATGDETPPPIEDGARYDGKVVDEKTTGSQTRRWQTRANHTPWQMTLRRLHRARGRQYNIGALLNDCPETAVRADETAGVLTVGFRNRVNLMRLEQELEASEATKERIEQAARESYGAAMEIELKMAADMGAVDPVDNGIVQAALRIGARIVPNRP